jgi:peptidoglycan-associated lipoprotein
MKLNKFTNLLIATLILAVAAGSGCRKRTGWVTPIPEAAKTGGAPADAGPGKSVPPGETAGTTGTTGTDVASKEGSPQPDPGSHLGWKENADIFKADTVHFDFDSSVVKASEKPHAAAVADHLKADGKAAVRVEGNCDERGTEEYNRALGERRALAVREELIRLGVDPKRVETISYGEDRAVDPGHDEAAWKKNRRADFILLTPP